MTGPACPYRVLVVDDCPDNAEVVSVLVARLGHISRVAHDGRTAIDEVSRFHPEIVILDLGLPDISGIEVARSLREAFEPGQLHIAALTGYGRRVDRDDARAAGIDQFVLKPGNVRTLISTAVEQLSEIRRGP